MTRRKIDWSTAIKQARKAKAARKRRRCRKCRRVLGQDGKNTLCFECRWPEPTEEELDRMIAERLPTMLKEPKEHPAQVPGGASRVLGVMSKRWNGRIM